MTQGSAQPILRGACFYHATPHHARRTPLSPTTIPESVTVSLVYSKVLCVICQPQTCHESASQHFTQQCAVIFAHQTLFQLVASLNDGRPSVDHPGVCFPCSQPALPVDVCCYAKLVLLRICSSSVVNHQKNHPPGDCEGMVKATLLAIKQCNYFIVITLLLLSPEAVTLYLACRFKQ